LPPRARADDAVDHDHQRPDDDQRLERHPDDPARGEQRRLDDPDEVGDDSGQQHEPKQHVEEELAEADVDQEADEIQTDDVSQTDGLADRHVGRFEAARP